MKKMTNKTLLSVTNDEIDRVALVILYKLLLLLTLLISL